MNVLHLHAHFEHRGSVKESMLLARDLPRGAVSAACLGVDGPASVWLRNAGVEPMLLGWTRAFDPAPLWRLRRRIRELDPDHMHVWDFKALRTLGLIARASLKRTIVSVPSPWRRKLAALDRWLLNQTACVVVRSEAEAAAWTRLGVATNRIRVVLPGVDARPIEKVGASNQFLAVGPLVQSKGLETTLYVLDILAQMDTRVSLDIVGDGPHRGRLEEIQRPRNEVSRVRFRGRLDSLDDALQRAGSVWAPSVGSGCTHTVLEAMAAGRAVIASDWPHLRELVRDGETGFLAPPGDNSAFARRVWRMLNVSEGTQRLGKAAADRARDHFPAARFVEHMERVYQRS